MSRFRPREDDPTYDTEPWVSEPPPQGPEFEVRTVPLCPICMGIVRREILNDGARGPWLCDLHGAVPNDAVLREELEIPARYAG